MMKNFIKKEIRHHRSYTLFLLSIFHLFTILNDQLPNNNHSQIPISIYLPKKYSKTRYSFKIRRSSALNRSISTLTEVHTDHWNNSYVSYIIKSETMRFVIHDGIMYAATCNVHESPVLFIRNGVLNEVTN